MTPKQTPAQRAAKLPAPRPGVAVDVKLELLPAYYQLHGIQAMTAGEIHEQVQRKPEAIVWVKRTRPGA